MAVQKLKMLPVECVVRGYITGSGWKDYQATGKVSGIELPPGLRESAEAADADLHAVDQGRRGPRRGDRHRRRPARSSATPSWPARLRDVSIALYSFAAELAAERGVILADTKFEFGLDDGRRADPRRRGADAGLLALLARRGLRARPRPAVASTSSSCATGRRRPAGTRAPPAPEVPDDVVAGTRAKYVEAYELVTGEPFDAWLARTRAHEGARADPPEGRASSTRRASPSSARCRRSASRAWPTSTSAGSSSSTSRTRRSWTTCAASCWPTR